MKPSGRLRWQGAERQGTRVSKALVTRGMDRSGSKPKHWVSDAIVKTIVTWPWPKRAFLSEHRRGDGKTCLMAITGSQPGGKWHISCKDARNLPSFCAGKPAPALHLPDIQELRAPHRLRAVSASIAMAQRCQKSQN